ncbi:hypothetical protein OF001_U20332 [Pseudomonas sp. OF001]|nr:hypothetical protein OF001_U20332 [Pseudomonas sp. OF001]
MRTLAEIVEDVQGGGTPDEEELRYAVSVLGSLVHAGGSALLRVAELNPTDPVQEFSDHVARIGAAWRSQPKQWLGWDSDPANPEYQERRRAATEHARRTLH